MKKLFTFLLVTIISVSTYAQDKIHVHTATVSNTIDNKTYIDHPDLNNNPTAKLVFSHVLNPNGESGIYNNHNDGLWYDTSAQKWVIYNEGNTSAYNIQIGAHYFIYIASDPNDVFTHIADAAHAHPTFSHVTLIDHPQLNNLFPGPFAIFSHVWNGVYNDNNYGFYFDNTENKRALFEENATPVPLNSGFSILLSGSGVITRFSHQAIVGNISANFTYLDNPNLNNNPNASFVFSHYWGYLTNSTVELDIKLTAGYVVTQGRWAIFTEDASTPIPEGMGFDIIVAEQEILGVNENELTTNISIFPNPANAFLNIASNAKITEVSIYNMLGQEILHLNNDQIDKNTIDVSNLTAGNYLLKVQSNKSVQTFKFIKN